MGDENDEWWNNPASPSPTPPGQSSAPPPPPPPSPDDAGPVDATVVIPPHQSTPHAPPDGPQYQQPPAPYPGQHAPQYRQPQAPPDYRSAGSPQPSERPRSILGPILMLIGAAGALVGTVLPWVLVDGFDFGDQPNGFEQYYFGDVFDPTLWSNPGAYVAGGFALVALIAVITLAVGKTVATSILSIVATVLASLTAVAAVAVVVNVLGDAFGDVTIGPGIGLVVLGALGSFVGSILVAVKS